MTLTAGAILAIAAVALVVVAIAWAFWANRKAESAENKLDNEEIEEADDAAKLRAATETDQQAVDRLAARLGTVPPSDGKS